MPVWIRAVILVAAVALPGSALDAAPPPGTTILPPIDLSPGPDVRRPSAFALNRTTHKMYIGANSGGNVMHALKTLDTRTSTVTGGFSFSAYPGMEPMRGYAMAVDESAGPEGNKLYVVGRVSNFYVVRVIDSANDTELTGPGTDIVLPISVRNEDHPSMFQIVVNPRTHKVYVSRADGVIVVIDGRTRKVITTFNPNAGRFLAVDPVANKIFVLGANGGAIIDGATDTVSAPPEPLLFVATGAAFNESDGRLYVVGYKPGVVNEYGLFVLDGRSGTMVGSNTELRHLHLLAGIAIVPSENLVYAGTTYEIYAFSTTDLSIRGRFPQPGSQLAYDPAAAGVLFASESIIEYTSNAVHVIDRATWEARELPTAYVPEKVVVNSRTNRIYVLDSEANEFVVVDGRDRSVIARVPTPRSYATTFSSLRDITVSERLNRVYISSERYPRFDPSGPYQPPTRNRFVDVYDGATHDLLRSFQITTNGTLALDDTRRRLYLPISRYVASHPDTWASHLNVHDDDTGRFIAAIEAEGRPFRGSLAVNPVTGRIYQPSGDDGVSVFDGGSLTRVGSAINVGLYPLLADVNRKTNTVYVAGETRVAVVDGSTNRTISSFAAAGNETRLSGIAVDEEADTVTVAETSRAAEGGFSRLRTYEGQNKHALLGEVEMADAAAGVAFNPVSRQFLVPHPPSGTISVVQAGGTAARNQFANLSTRLQVGGSDDVMISGVIVNAPSGATKKVIVRAVGPSLEALGVKGALADTTLELHTAVGDVITNDNWKINDATRASQQAEIEATGLAPGDDREAAIIADLPAGAHTAIIRGKDGATGVGLAEVFILENDSPAQLVNIATRGRVGTGEDVMIGGVIVKGTHASRVLVRAVGPSLEGKLAGALQDPMLELRDINGGLIAINDDWKSPHEAEIAATTIPPTHEKESAILADLFPGNYTAIVWGAADTTGVAVVEAYAVP